MRERTAVFWWAGLTVLGVFLLSLGWEFAFEMFIGHLVSPDFRPEPLQHRWEYVLTTTALTVVALIILTLVSLRSIGKRERAEEALRESELRFKTILNSAAPLITLKDLEGRYITVNQAFEEHHGVTADEVIGKSLADVYSMETAAARAALERQVIDTGKVIKQEVGSVRGPTGGLFLVTKFPIRNVKGDIVAVGTINTDISELGRTQDMLRRARNELELRVEERTRELAAEVAERTRAESALRASERRFRDVVEATSDWFWEMDENLRFTFFSERRHELANPSAEDKIGKTRWEVARADPDGDESWRRHRAALEAHEPFRDFEYAFPAKDGKTRYHKVSGKPVFDADGTFKGYRGAESDVTDQKEAQAQLIQASRLATLGEMASAIAHELNQPLSVVGMAAELCLMSMEDDAFDSEFVRRKLRTIATQKDRMAEITNHMRLFSRRDDTTPETFDPVGAVRRAIGLIAKQFQARGIDLEKDLPGTCRNVSGRPLQLEQVVINLLTNARDAVLGRTAAAPFAAAAGAPKVRISLVHENGAGNVVISVADNGGGIPEGALGRIFDPFFTTKKEGRRIGLGLSISYSIIDAMGGRLDADNTHDGARFRITLPVSGNDGGAADRRPRDRRRKPPPRRTPSPLPRVLVIEDEGAIVEEVSDYLGRKGYEVVTAANAIEALEAHKSRPADMVITDLLMPGMGGDEVIRRLRRTDPGLPILVVTGHTTFGEEQDILADGTLVVLKKPINLRELLQHLQHMTRT